MKRNVALDMLRGLAMLIVIFGHSLQGAGNGDSSNPLHLFIQTFQMPLFFLISGFSAGYSSNTTFFRSLKNKALRILVPYIAWVWLFYFAQIAVGHIGFSFSECFGRLLWSDFWFLRKLLFVLLSFEVYRVLSANIVCRPVRILLSLSLPVGILFAAELLPGESYLLYFAMYFWLGYLIHSVVPEKYLTFNINSDGFFAKSLSWCGRNSLQLYAVHWNIFFAVLSLSLIDFSAWNINFYLVSVFLFLLYTFGSVAVIIALRKFPLLPKIFLGDK